MPEQVTVIITETAPGGGSRFYQEPGRPSSVDVDSLTPNTEYRADAEYEAPDGTTIQASNSMTFRTLPVGMFSISNPNWQNDNDGQHSTFTFDYTSTYALSYAQVVDMATGVTYQGTIVGSSVTAQLPAGTAGTQHNFQLIIADIYGYSYVQGYVMTLEASLAETPFYIELVDSTQSGTVKLSKNGAPATLTMLYSFDNATYNTYTIDNNITLDSSHPRVYFKNSGNTRFSNGEVSYYKFVSGSGYIKVGGNIAFLKSNDGTNTTSQAHDFLRLFSVNNYLSSAKDLYLGNYTTLAQRCYRSMFHGCTSLTTAPALPATTLANECYRSMFMGCTALRQAPALPATTLADHCYHEMFYECTALTQAPALPATTLASYCYASMFVLCTSLRRAPALPATTLADHCYYSMFEDCRALRQAPALPATTLADYCYYEMFMECESITTAPALPATTLANYCYYGMFSNCYALTQAPALPATTLANYCYYGMFMYCQDLTQAPALPATTLTASCYRCMFCGCYALTQAPALPATTLTDYCYYEMFQYCNALVSAPALPATTLASYCYYEMFRECKKLTQAPALPATTLANYCYAGMFQQCIKLTQAPALPATTLVPSCYTYMFYYCTLLREITCLAEVTASASTRSWVDRVAATGTFYKSPNMSSWSTGDSGIPSGWTVQDY